MKSLSSVMVALLSSTFLSAPAIAYDVRVDSLNNLTGPKISWSDSEGTAVTIGEQTFYYTYNKPDDYTETSTRVNGPTADITGQLFSGISSASGAAVYSKSQSGSDINIDSDFVGNHGTTSGGAIYRYAPSTIKNISGTFIGNYVRTGGESAVGGAVYTTRPSSSNSIIDTLIGNFVSNYVLTTGANSSFSHGGAVDNHGTINYLEGNFIGNYGKSTGGAVMLGGALHNGSTNAGYIVTLKGNFIGNYIDVGGSNYGSGGGVNNDGVIDEIVDSNFVYNYVTTKRDARGGAIGNTGTIGNITVSEFSNNSVTSSNYARGGAIYNSETGTIGAIVADKIENNYAGSEGGAVLNRNHIDSITASIISGNHSRWGGAIYNSYYDNSYQPAGERYIGSINADFIGNYVDTCAGAIYNSGTIEEINGNFIGNYVKNDNSYVMSGAIYNAGYDAGIGIINGNINDNYAESSTFAYGGAIYNGSTIGTINGNIFNNYAYGGKAGEGGAIDNGETIGTINGDIYSNYVKSPEAYGGAIYDLRGTIEQINGDIYNNYVEGNSIAYGGAWYQNMAPYLRNVYDVDREKIDNVYITKYTYTNEDTDEVIEVYSRPDDEYLQSIKDSLGNEYEKIHLIYREYTNTISNEEFEDIKNNAEDLGYYVDTGMDIFSDEDYAQVIDTEVQDIDAPVNLTNVNFTGNYAKASAENGVAKGGAIWSGRDFTLNAKGETVKISGNYVEDAQGKRAEGIFMQKAKVFDEEGEVIVGYYYNPTLTLNAVENGKMIVDDIIDGDGYHLSISGDGTGVVKFNNLVKNVTNFTLGENSVTHLGIKSKVYAQNMSIATSSIPGGNAVSSPIITVDVEVDKNNNKVDTAQIWLDNDVEGEYQVIVNSLNTDVLPNRDDAIVPFLFAPNDDMETSSGFSVTRVIGSPYMWFGSINAKGETEGSTWYLNLPEGPQPKPEKIYAPEVIAGIGLHEAAIEQTRSVVHNVKGKVESGREFCPACGMYSYNWDGKKLRNIWALAQGESANIDKPVDIEAKIWGLEAGFDVQSDLHNTLGVFASYRKGQYDLSGKGSKLRSNIGSEIDINSYLAGLYYRYDHNFNWLFGTIYGGMQEAEVETEDHIAKLDTDGIEFGASIEFGRTIPLARDLTLDPSVGLYYTQVNFDDTKDNVGKHYEWDDIKHLEAELGAKLEKQFDNAKVYVKPSVIQTLTDDDSVIITGLSKADTYHDQTLGRIEIGGRYGFTDALSAYAWANYTFGSSYDAYALGAGLNYAW